MLLAILFQNETIVAAAAACDQSPYGNQFWLETHSVGLMADNVFTEADFRNQGFETSYLEIKDKQICESLLQVGLDDTIDVNQLQSQLQQPAVTELRPNRAA